MLIPPTVFFFCSGFRNTAQAQMKPGVVCDIEQYATVWHYLNNHDFPLRRKSGTSETGTTFQQANSLEALLKNVKQTTNANYSTPTKN